MFVLDNPSKFEEQLHEVSRLLHFRKTVVLFLDNDVLTQTGDLLPIHPIDIKRESHNIGELVAGFERTVHHKRIILIVGEQAIHCPEIKALTTQLCQNLKAAVIWSMNGVNCVDSNNPYAYGCVSFGGNDHAVNLLQSINQDDVVLAVGLCPDEYTTNLQKIGAGHTYFLTDVVDSYGQIDGEYKHHALHDSSQINAPIEETLKALIQLSDNKELNNKHFPLAPENLNIREVKAPAAGYVDMEQLYQRLHQWWRPNSIVVADVCLTYKDYQYVTQKPNNNITYFSCYRGSAMGSAYGVAVGAKLADPSKNVFAFSGEVVFGCMIVR